MIKSVPEGFIIAIDGPAGAGKSTLARLLANELGIGYMDTGAMYRALTVRALSGGVDVRDPDAVAQLARDVSISFTNGPGDPRVLVDGQDVSEQLRSEEVNVSVSIVAAHAGVREVLVNKQQQIIRSEVGRGGIVVEGRDIATVVAPEAQLKVYLEASQDVRTHRRNSHGSGDVSKEPAAKDDVAARDASDSTRASGPLTRAEDAHVVDTTLKAPEQTVSEILGLLAGAEATCGKADGDVAARPAVTSAPKVAVVGRPNVGKSTLVNRIAARRDSIVGPVAGTTRDRKSLKATWAGKDFELLDTGGLHGVSGGLGRSSDELSAAVSAQSSTALAEADAILFVVEATVGITAHDMEIARSLRILGKDVTLVVNKAEGAAAEQDAAEFWGLGLGPPFAVSALHGEGIGELLDALVGGLAPVALTETDAIAQVALVGRPNVGKSSLFNRLVGSNRAVVHEVAGTTRDTVDSVVELDGGRWKFLDTAGMRRDTKTKGTEYCGLVRARKAISQADIVLLVLDAHEGVTGQDMRIASELEDAGCSTLIIANKWDLIDADDKRREFERSMQTRMRVASHAPLIRTSALTNRGVNRIAPVLLKAAQARLQRVATARLNSSLERLQQRHPPAMQKHTRPRVLYATQAAVAPPTFVLFCTGSLPPSWVRYVERSLREEFGFFAAPVRIRVRKRTRTAR